MIERKLMYISTGEQLFPAILSTVWLVGRGKKSLSPVLTEGLSAVVTPAYVVSKPTTASKMVDSGASSAPTVLVVGTDEVVNQAPVSSTYLSESTQLILNPATSQGSALPGSAPQDIPKLDSGITSNVDSTQVSFFYLNNYSLCLFSLFIHLVSLVCFFFFCFF